MTSVTGISAPYSHGIKQNFGPRGVLRCYADGRIEDTGQLTKKRMEAIDDEVFDAATEWLDRKGGQYPPFCKFLVESERI